MNSHSGEEGASGVDVILTEGGLISLGQAVIIYFRLTGRLI